MIPIKKGALLGFTNTQEEQIVDPTYMVADAYCEGMSLIFNYLRWNRVFFSLKESKRIQKKASLRFFWD